VISTPSNIWAHPSLSFNRHFDRFICFCRDHKRDQQTQTQTTLLRLKACNLFYMRYTRMPVHSR